MADENKLSKEVQIFIVEQIACYRSPRIIIDAVKELFEVTPSKQQIYYYEQLCQKRLKGKSSANRIELENLYELRRQEFKTKVEEIPCYNLSNRLDTLNEMLNIERAKGDKYRRDPLILQILEQIAKEVGGMFTNRREISGPKGGPIVTHAKTLDQWKEDANSRINQAAEVVAMFEVNEQ